MYFDILKLANRQQKSATSFFTLFLCHFGKLRVFSYKRSLHAIHLSKSHFTNAL